MGGRPNCKRDCTSYPQSTAVVESCCIRTRPGLPTSGPHIPMGQAELAPMFGLPDGKIDGVEFVSVEPSYVFLIIENNLAPTFR